MKTLLVTTSYCYDGKIESFTRAYLPTAEESAVAQAEDWAQKAKIVFDAGTALSHTSVEVTPEGLRTAVKGRSEMIAMVGRVCALEAIDNGAPAIPEGQTFGEWRDQKDAFTGDYDFLREVVGEVDEHDNRLFAEAYLKNLFDASPCGPSPAQDKEAKEKGLADGAEHADALDQEQGADGLRQTQRPDQLAWDESARNAGAFEISCRGLPSDCRDTYYEAYNEGAESRTRELLAAYEEDE